MDEFAEEVAASLEFGDHRSLGRLPLRGLLGLGVIAFGVLSSRRAVTVDHGDVIHVVANPVAHGARLTLAVGNALSVLRVVRLADARLSAVPVDVHAPGLGARSMKGIVYRTAIARALQLRRHVGRASMRSLSPNWLYSEYLFLAQAIRYTIAEEAFAEVPESTIVLTDFDRSAYARPWIWAAHRRGLRTVTMVHGSPTTNYVPVLAGTVLTWGPGQSDWFARHSPSTASVIVGRPEMEAEVQPRGSIARVVICHSAEVLSGSEARRLVDAVREFRRRGVKSLVRLHPSVPLDRVTGLWSEVIRAADDVIATRESFIESLRPGDGVLCVISTSAVEALVAGFPVAVVADNERELPVDLEALRTADPVLWLTDADTHQASERVVAFTGSASSERLLDAMTQRASR